MKSIPKAERGAHFSTIEQMNIKALGGSKMKPGKVYRVSKQSGAFLIKNKRAIEADRLEAVGQIYEIPEARKSADNITK